MSTLKETRAAYLTDHALTGEALLEARFDLPRRYAWFNELTTQERLDFFAGLLAILVNPVLVLPNGKRRTRQAALDEYLRGWAATAEIESSPELLQAIRAGRADLQHGRLVSYAEVFDDVPR
jgi:hypothetical protein